jgi:hypothetical protein
MNSEKGQIGYPFFEFLRRAIVIKPSGLWRARKYIRYGTSEGVTYFCHGQRFLRSGGRRCSSDMILTSKTMTSQKKLDEFKNRCHKTSHIPHPCHPWKVERNCLCQVCIGRNNVAARSSGGSSGSSGQD